ncbi:hypothetical protein [Tahibacter amnicola]|uniref:Uncharacterized protein n=1 Tax=Tahibacter amnicola TaxID=2976241 RepID=A0ABY6BFW9_9GAMM|nr:hypothetical protein [Tahibacter amnicola]UXI68928.1 hypothetical protein N4264_04530 [Tahibacter amnicola]
MDTRKVIRSAVLVGTVAAVVSTLAVSVCSRRQTGHGASGTNATSHWLWRRRALRQHRPSLRYTALGYLIHHASSIWWALFFAGWRQPGDQPLRVAAKAGTIAAAAAAVDYGVVPRRLTPGFEAHLRLSDMALVYAAFAAGLVIGDQWSASLSPGESAAEPDLASPSRAAMARGETGSTGTTG